MQYIVVYTTSDDPISHHRNILTQMYVLMMVAVMPGEEGQS